MVRVAKSVRVSRRGQVVIPIEVRRPLGIRAGDTVVIVSGDHEAIVMKPGRYAESLKGMAKGIFGRTREEIDAFVRAERQAWGK